MTLDLGKSQSRSSRIKTSIILGLLILVVIGQFTILGSLNQLYKKIDRITFYCSPYSDQKSYDDQKKSNELNQKH